MRLSAVPTACSLIEWEDGVAGEGETVVGVEAIG
jgi:hypothetical protein